MSDDANRGTLDEDSELLASKTREHEQVPTSEEDTTSVGLFEEQVSFESFVPLESRSGHLLTFAGLYLFTAFLYFRPYELFEALSWTSSAALIFAIFTLLVFIPSQMGLATYPGVRPREVDLALLLLLAAGISIPMALEPERSIDAIIDFAKVILMFVVIVNSVRTRNRLWALVWLVLIASCMISGFAVYDYSQGRMTLGGERIQGVIGGIFSNPNDLALQLVMMAPIAAGLFLATRNLASRFLYFAFVVIFVLGIVATFSRGGLIGFVGALSIFLWRGVRRNRFLVLGTVLVIGLGFLVLAPSEYGARISTTNDGSVMTRQDELKRSLFLMFGHPLFGVGMDNFVLYSNDEHATHNAYTQVGSELGVVAMMIYILFLTKTLKRIKQMQKTFEETRDTESRWFAVGLEASLIGYMVSSFFLSVAFLWYVYYLVGYAICFDQITRPKNNAIATAPAMSAE